MDTSSVYNHHRSLLVDAIDERLFTGDYLDLLIASGAAHIVATPKSAIVFEAKAYPSGWRDVHGLVAAGDLRDIVETLIPQAEAWGRANGCSGALIESRPGWARILKQYGYEPHQLAVRKEL